MITTAYSDILKFKLNVIISQSKEQLRHFC